MIVAAIDRYQRVVLFMGVSELTGDGGEAQSVRYGKRSGQEQRGVLLVLCKVERGVCVDDLSDVVRQSVVVV